MRHPHQTRLASKGLTISPTQVLKQCDVIAKLWMTIERQVIRQQRQIVLHQAAYTRTLHTRQGDRFVAPKIAVMHQQRIRVPSNRLINDIRRRGHTKR